MEDLKRIEQITRNYEALQGLKILPLGLYFLILALGWLGEQGDCTFTLPALIGALILYGLIGKYYQRRFGQVKPLQRNLGKEILVLIVAFVVFWLASYFDYSLNLSINLVGLTIAAGLILVFSQPSQRFRIHYLVMGVLVALISLLPLMGISRGGEIIQPPGPVFNLLVGLVIIVGGIFDHYLLGRLFNTPAEARHG